MGLGRTWCKGSDVRAHDEGNLHAFTVYVTWLADPIGSQVNFIVTVNYGQLPVGAETRDSLFR